LARSSPRTSRTSSRSGEPDARLTTFDRRILASPTLEAARAVLGAQLVRAPEGRFGPRAARIVEVEAYIGEDDRASHARFGRTARNLVMYGPPGVAYVYLVYGMYDCLNIVTEPAGRPAAVLVRAVEPIDGIAAMRRARLDTAAERRRGRPAEIVAADAMRVMSMDPTGLARGPGLVCAALSIDRSLTGVDLLDVDSPLRLEPAPADEPDPPVSSGPRIGIGYAGEAWAGRPWRFWITGNPAVSRPGR
jgi:DNA-3-methyladenine glycosylase